MQETYETHPDLREACERALTSHIDAITADIKAAKDLYAPEASWTPESVGTFIQAVLQGSFIFAKATQGAEVVVENIDHLRRYLQMLFPRQESRVEERKPTFMDRYHLDRGID